MKGDNLTGATRFDRGLQLVAIAVAIYLLLHWLGL